MATTAGTQTIKSADGTSIAFDRKGSGPALILLIGASADRQMHDPLAQILARDFTVYNVDRRGRGESGDERAATFPYSVEREFEDLRAIIAEAGGSAHLYGISSGGALALEAAAAGLPVNSVAVYEVPYNLADEQPQIQSEYVAGLERAAREGRPGDQAELFLRVMGTDDAGVAAARLGEWWPGMVANERSLLYDALAMGSGQPPLDRLATITVPTLVLTGDPEGEHEVGSTAFFDAAASAIAAAVPHAVRRKLPGQTHMVDPQVIGPVLSEFFGSSTR